MSFKLIFRPIKPVIGMDMTEKVERPHSYANPDKLDIHTRGVDHVRAVYRESNQGDHACPRRGTSPWS